MAKMVQKWSFWSKMALRVLGVPKYIWQVHMFTRLKLLFAKSRKWPKNGLKMVTLSKEVISLKFHKL